MALIGSLLLGCEGTPPRNPDEMSGSFTASDPCNLPGNVCRWLGVAPPGATTRLPGEGTDRSETFLTYPHDITFAEDGTAYYAESSIDRIRRVGTDDIVHTVCAGSGMFGDEQDCREGCPALDSGLRSPMDVAVSAIDTSSLWVADQGNGRVNLLDLSTETMFWWASGLGFPTSIVLADDGTLYVSDDITDWILRISPEGLVEAVARPPDVGEPRLALDGDILWIADAVSDVVRGIDVAACASDVSDCVIRATYGAGVFGQATDVAVGPSGDVYVADAVDHCVRVVRPDGTVDVFAGRCTEAGYAGDGGPAIDALFDNPRGVAVDTSGNVHVTDTNNHIVRRIVPLP